MFQCVLAEKDSLALIFSPAHFDFLELCLIFQDDPPDHLLQSLVDHQFMFLHIPDLQMRQSLILGVIPHGNSPCSNPRMLCG